MTAAVRILGKDKKVAGSGMILDSNHILTCAHVLVGAYSPRPKQGDEIWLRLLGKGNKEVAATLLPFPWLSEDGVLPESPREIEDFVDFVVLSCPTPISQIPKFRQVGRFEKRLEVRASGVTADRPSGVNTQVTFEGSDDNGRFQFNWPGEGNFPVDRGFSGSPLEYESWIIGMVVARFFSGDSNKPPLSYGLPMNAVAECIRQYLTEVPLKVQPALHAFLPNLARVPDWLAEKRRAEHASKREVAVHFRVAIARKPTPEPVSGFAGLHLDPTAIDLFDVLTVDQLLTQIAEGERKRYYLHAPGGSGKTSLVEDLLENSVDYDIACFYLDCKGTAQTDADELVETTLIGRARSFPLRSSDIEAAFKKNVPVLLLFDSVNEGGLKRDEIPQLLDSLAKRFSQASLVVADRMTALDRYPTDFDLVTVVPLGEQEILAVVAKFPLAQKVYLRLSPGSRQILRLPFFLDLFIAGPESAEGGTLRGSLVQKYLERSLNDLPNTNTADAIARLAEMAYTSYERGGGRTLTLDQIKTSLGDLRGPCLDAGLLNEMPAQKIYAFRHQLIHDYLAARHFVNSPAKGNLDALTMGRSSLDALPFAYELVADHGKDQFLRDVYDWEYAAAIECIAALRTGRRSRPLEKALCVVVADKLSDRFLSTRTKAARRQQELVSILELPDGQELSPKRLREHVQSWDTDFRDTAMSSWRRIFLAGPDAIDEILEALLSSDSLQGWTAANSIKRLPLGCEDFRILKIVLKGLSDTPDRSVARRWRITHALAAKVPSELETEVVQFLQSTAANKTEHKDVRYGAARSLMDLASNAGEEQKCADILNWVRASLKEQAESPDTIKEDGEVLDNLSRALDPYRNCAVINEIKSREPEWWGPLVEPLLDQGSKCFPEGSKYRKAWQDELKRFRSADRLAPGQNG